MKRFLGWRALTSRRCGSHMMRLGLVSKKVSVVTGIIDSSIEGCGSMSLRSLG